VIHAVAVSDKVKAVAALAAYFRMQEGYRGPAELPGLCTWMAEQDPRLGIELFPARTAGGVASSHDDMNDIVNPGT